MVCPGCRVMKRTSKRCKRFETWQTRHRQVICIRRREGWDAPKRVKDETRNDTDQLQRIWLLLYEHEKERKKNNIQKHTTFWHRRVFVYLSISKINCGWLLGGSGDTSLFAIKLKYNIHKYIHQQGTQAKGDDIFSYEFVALVSLHVFVFVALALNTYGTQVFRPNVGGQTRNLMLLMMMMTIWELRARSCSLNPIIDFDFKMIE